MRAPGISNKEGMGNKKLPSLQDQVFLKHAGIKINSSCHLESRENQRNCGTSAKVCGGPCGPGRTSMFQLFPVVKGLTPSSRGEGAASGLTSSNIMFSYLRIII